MLKLLKDWYFNKKSVVDCQIRCPGCDKKSKFMVKRGDTFKALAITVY